MEQNHPPVEPGNTEGQIMDPEKARYMADYEGWYIDQARAHENFAFNPLPGGTTTPEAHIQQAVDYRTQAEAAGEQAGRRYDLYQGLKAIYGPNYEVSRAELDRILEAGEFPAIEPRANTESNEGIQLEQQNSPELASEIGATLAEAMAAQADGLVIPNQYGAGARVAREFLEVHGAEMPGDTATIVNEAAGRLLKAEQHVHDERFGNAFKTMIGLNRLGEEIQHILEVDEKRKEQGEEGLSRDEIMRLLHTKVVPEFEEASIAHGRQSDFDLRRERAVRMEGAQSDSDRRVATDSTTYKRVRLY